MKPTVLPRTSPAGVLNSAVYGHFPTGHGVTFQWTHGGVKLILVHFRIH